MVRSAASGYASGNASQLLAGGRRINGRAATPPDGCSGDRIGRCRHVGSHSSCRRRCPRAAGRPQPDRPGRGHCDGHDDGRRRRWRGDTGRLALSLSGHPDRRPRALRPEAGAAAREEGPDCIRELDAWGVGWARKDGHIAQAHAPGHDRPRCVYVDFLNTGPAVSKTLRTALHKRERVRRFGDLMILDLVRGFNSGCSGDRRRSPRRDHGRGRYHRGEGEHHRHGRATRIYARTGPPATWSDGYAIALRAGAKLIHMEFVHLPDGHLAPRMIGMDPIMWINSATSSAGASSMATWKSSPGATHEEDGKYVITRDTATYAILQEVAAGRGSPHGGAYLSFMHIPAEQLQAAFGPVIERLAANGITLTGSRSRWRRLRTITGRHCR